MKTLSEIKDEVAVNNEYADWCQIDMTENSDLECEAIKATMLDEVAKRYAEEALKEAAERAPWAGDCEVSKVCKSKIESSILNIIKELK